jgi:hypothetical protein
MRNPALEVYFYATEQGNEPVRQRLKLQSTVDKKRIGGDIKTVQFGWRYLGDAHPSE